MLKTYDAKPPAGASQSPLEIRKAALSDAEGILKTTREAFAVYAKIAGLGTNVEALGEGIADIKKDIEEKLVLVALQNGRIIGSVRLEVKPCGSAYLSRFGVSPSCQGVGIGGVIMGFVDAEMAKHGVSALSLHTAAKAESLMHFYCAHGFEKNSVDYERGYERVLLIKKY